MSQNKYCQSCGVPLKDDPERRGTEANGSRNDLYCCYCYQKGKFTYPNFTVKEMQDFCVTKLVEMKFPKWVARIMVRNIPKLERWKNN